MANRSVRVLSADSTNLNPVNARRDARNTTSELPLGENRETLSAAVSDNGWDGEADWDQHQERLFAERDFPGRFSVSTLHGASTCPEADRDQQQAGQFADHNDRLSVSSFDSAGTHSTYYRDR
ncbi:hypothetical protein AAVH_11334 [Aphelenchoides avenae]|nr:hypothetical protein AAVH_11334 [Aphelenchus avenae]